MTLAAELESKLNAARLRVLVPVLVELGVECSNDLEFMQESDINSRNDISVIQKRRFLDLRAKIMESDGTTTSDDEDDHQLHEVKMYCAGSEGTGSTQTADFSRSQPTGCKLPPQTPRTRALPLVEILREVENLDEALKEEREKTAKLTEEKRHLVENHARDISMLEDMLQSLLAENESLKATVAAWEVKHGPSGGYRPHVINEVVDEDEDEPEPCESPIVVRGHYEGEPEPAADFSSEGRPSIGEPEMEPRRTALPLLNLPVFGSSP